MTLIRYQMNILILSLLVISSCEFEHNHPDKTNRPNILFLLADDLGYGELGCYGQEVIKTPILDQLARKGMKFTNFYAGNAVCSPSRAVLMTGKQSTYCTIRGNSGYYDNEDKWYRVPLKKNEITLGEMLQNGGYQTAFVGKWHLDDADDLSTWAHSRGFEYAAQEQWTMRHGGRHYQQDVEYVNGLEDSVIYKLEEWESKDDFRTDLAINYLDNIDEKNPFFLFMSFRAPHGHEREIGNKTLYSDAGWDKKERLHAAKITLLDQHIGRLLDKLKDLGKLENTLVVFTSDNGPHHEGHDPDFFNSNGPFQGYKRDMYEGGLRVPLIAYWADKIEAGTTTDHIGSFQDFMPTLAEIARIKVPDQSNGISLLPVLKGEEAKLRNHLVWEIQLDGHWRKMPNGGFRQGVRMNKWKAVRYGVKTPTKLFDLEKDQGELNDVSDKYPEIRDKMEEILKSDRSDNEYFPYGGVFKIKQ